MHRLSTDHLRRGMRRALASFDLTPRHVEFVVDTLLTTSLNGIDTHGVRLLEIYARELAEGRAKARPKLSVASTAPAAALLDADDALGVVAANEGIQLAIERARAQGVGAVAIANSNHCGALGYYVNLAAASDTIALAFTNSDALVAPQDGRMALNGTNPLAMAAPGVGDETFSLDMCTSQTSFLKALRAAAAAGAVPHATGLRGLPEPLAPLAGYKGQGLGTMVQILCAVLTGMPFDSLLTNMCDLPYDRGRKIGQVFICLDVRAFGPVDPFRARVSELLQLFRTSPPRDPGSPVLVSGDLERRTREERLREGVPVAPETWTFLKPWMD